jgi:hypothetical protein
VLVEPSFWKPRQEMRIVGSHQRSYSPPGDQTTCARRGVLNGGAQPTSPLRLPSSPSTADAQTF